LNESCKRHDHRGDLRSAVIISPHPEGIYNKNSELRAELRCCFKIYGLAGT